MRDATIAEIKVEPDSSGTMRLSNGWTFRFKESPGNVKQLEGKTVFYASVFLLVNEITIADRVGLEGIRFKPPYVIDEAVKHQPVESGPIDEPPIPSGTLP